MFPYWDDRTLLLCFCPCRTMVNAAFTTIPEGAFSHLHLLQFLWVLLKTPSLHFLTHCCLLSKYGKQLKAHRREHLHFTGTKEGFELASCRWMVIESSDDIAVISGSVSVSLLMTDSSQFSVETQRFVCLCCSHGEGFCLCLPQFLQTHTLKKYLPSYFTS